MASSHTYVCACHYISTVFIQVFYGIQPKKLYSLYSFMELYLETMDTRMETQERLYCSIFGKITTLSCSISQDPNEYKTLKVTSLILLHITQLVRATAL